MTAPIDTKVVRGLVKRGLRPDESPLVFCDEIDALRDQLAASIEETVRWQRSANEIEQECLKELAASEAARDAMREALEEWSNYWVAKGDLPAPVLATQTALAADAKLWEG